MERSVGFKEWSHQVTESLAGHKGKGGADKVLAEIAGSMWRRLIRYGIARSWYRRKWQVNDATHLLLSLVEGAYDSLQSEVPALPKLSEESRREIELMRR